MPTLEQLSGFYLAQLREQILPFWLKHAPDRKYGGYFTCLDRDGSVYDEDKVCMWAPGRIAWTFAYLYNELEAEPAWLDFARLGVDFTRRHGFRPDGRMYYGLKRDGTPLAAPAGFAAEQSTVQGWVAYAQATRDEGLYREARRLFDRTWAALQDPAGGASPRLAESGPIRLHGSSMITLNVIHQLRSYREEPSDAQRLDICIDAIRRFHLRPKQKVLLEMTGWNGEDLAGSPGRRVNPGHMIEGGIFLIHEATHRADPALKQLGLDLIRWGYEWGWDREFGGIFNDCDTEGRPIADCREILLADSKLWWQHGEALYALLLAYAESGDAWFLQAYEKVHAYSFSHFADPEYGEWFAYLDRTGRLVNAAKGTDRKTCFHIARNFFWCARLAERWAKPA
jgi:N-acylglucosamine 2-epimerase